jgi:hypothetical protein
VARALLALTTRKGRNGVERISYADLGVEQLGAVYEHLLDFVVSDARSGPTLVRTGRRKATGSFYTPRSLTEFLVRRTLAPLVDGATPERILQLRILDPSMGSGAFLVAACRFLATAYEQALIAQGALTAADLQDDERGGFRRAVAQQCLFGVDVNPMAVQLGRLSLWLATLSGERPLTFLDHHLRVGNSLVGASMSDLLTLRTPGQGSFRPRDLPLFPYDEMQASLESAVGLRLGLARIPDDTLEQVRSKERTITALNRDDGPLGRWKRAASLWCAGWFMGDAGAPDRAALRAGMQRILKKDDGVAAVVVQGMVEAAGEIGARERFFHWPFEFPEVFHDGCGVSLPEGGFDAVIGNPPWDMLHDEGGASSPRSLAAFARGSATYRLQGNGHANLYQLFVERALQLLKPGGRAGLILPSGFATDQSCGRLRRFLFDRTSIDTFTTLENREAIFPIHRSLKFLLLTFTHAGRTEEVPCRSGVRSPDELDRDDRDRAGQAGVVCVPRALLDRIGGEGAAVPEMRSDLDLQIVSEISFRVPALGDGEGWRLRFGRELNATDDRPHFSSGDRGLPVVEGKQIHPFVVDTGTCRYRIDPRVAARLLDPDRTFRRARLGYRDVASPTNRTTLIAAIIPPNVVTTHTVFCGKELMEESELRFLCGVFNSYVANYLVRMRVGTHVTAAIVARLPVPKPAARDPVFEEVAGVSRALSRRFDESAFARLNALVTALYGITRDMFAHVLTAFPLIPPPQKDDALRAFDEVKV